MTVIVFDGTTLAADSQVTTGFFAPKRASITVNKIMTPEEGERWTIHNRRILAIGICGDLNGVTQLTEILKKGVGLDTRGTQSCETDCIAVCDDRSFYILNNYGKDTWEFSHIPAGQKSALGSGAQTAQAYLAINKKAPEVVKLVSKIDLTCGGDVNVWDFPEVVPEDVKPEEPTQTQKDLIKKAEDQLQDIVKSALEKATAEIKVITTEPVETTPAATPAAADPAEAAPVE